MTETVSYEILQKIEPVEIRRYPAILLAEVENDEDDSGFNHLFQYISGANTTRGRIPMTTPVVTSEKITMTAPVLTKSHSMAFALPSSYTDETAPAPTDPAVHLELQPPRTLAVLHFSGHTPRSRVQEKTQDLLSILKQHHIQFKGEPILMRYNSPFTPGFFRRNEVAVEIS